MAPAARGPAVTCLLPVRNGERLLPGWFESVARFADAVVALDDGSTDGTAACLAGNPLVTQVLTSPRRDSYRGWDDRANRAKLLDAVGDLCPNWIMQLDADERITPDDAEALRDFLLTGADTSAAYLFKVHRMVDDVHHFDRADLWAGRAFAWTPGQRFPDDRLHFVPIPVSIPAARRLRTTIRIQHLAGLTADDRAARYEKYREADPGSEFHPDYRSLLDEPVALSTWVDRPPCLPVIVNQAWHHEERDLGRVPEDEPLLTAIVIARDDEVTIADSVASVVDQRCDAPVEVIVVASGSDRTAAVVRERFPGVNVIELSGVALPGRARNAGVAVARGRYISFPGSHVRLPAGSLAARLAAHRRGYAMVTGTTQNGTNTASGWASYFLDHNSVLPGRPSEVLSESPAHCSYLRDALLTVGGFREDVRTGEDTLVNNALFALGYGAWRDRDLRLVHHTPCRTPARLARHHFVRGRGFGRLLLLQHRPGKRFLTRRTVRSVLVVYIPGRVARVGRAVQRWGDAELNRRWRRVLPLVVLATTAAWLGTWFELLRPQPGKLRVLLGRQAAA